MLSCVERDRATIKAPWKPVLYKLALHRGKPVHYKLALHRGMPVHYKLALYRGMPVHTVTFSRIRVHRCRTPCKFVVGRDPLSKSTVRVKKSRSLIVLVRAGCFPPLSPGILVCRASAITCQQCVIRSHGNVVTENWPIAEEKPAINKTARFDLLKLMAFGCTWFGVPRERLLVVLSCFEEISPHARENHSMSKRLSISSRIPCKAKQELLYISVAVKCYFMHMIDTSFSHRNISFATFHLLQALVLNVA